MVEKKDIEVIDTKSAPAQAIDYAISKGATIEQLEKLFLLKKEYEADEARKAYNVAMANFKAKPTKIEKGKTVKFNATKWNYAPLNSIVEAITPELSKNGLSVSWRTKQNGKIIVACRISHVLGHYEEIELSADADTSGSKNSIQAMGSTISYLQRYTLTSILGLAAEDMDDDGQAVTVEYIDDKQRNKIVDMLTSKNINMEKFCQAFGIVELAKLPKARFEQAIASVNKVKKVTK